MSSRGQGIEALSTHGLGGVKRLEFWNDVVCNTFTPLTVDVPEGGFDARMRRQNLGEVRFAIADSSPARVTHTREQASRCCDAYFLLHLQLKGYSVNQQSGREVFLSPGDLTLFDSTRPYRVAFERSTSILVVRIPRDRLREHVACAEDIVMLLMPRSNVANRLAARFIRDVWRKLPEVDVERPARHLTDALMNVTAAACATISPARFECSTHATALRIRLIELIEANLSNPDLNPTVLARKGRISVRYLHALFQEQGESVCRYLQRRRLEVCARILKDPLRAASSVTQIACEYGFKSSAHFCRAFRERYGMTPSDFRLT